MSYSHISTKLQTKAVHVCERKQEDKPHKQLHSNIEVVDYVEDSSGKHQIGRWNIGATLGKDGYSWVKKGTDRKNGRLVLLKFVNTQINDQQKLKKSQIKQAKIEIEALLKIRHPNIVCLLAYNLNAKYLRNGKSRDIILLVLEYAAGGELFDILYYTNKLPPIVACTYFKELIYAVQACHESGIIHRDIKLRNILFDRDHNLKVCNSK